MVPSLFWTLEREKLGQFERWPGMNPMNKAGGGGVLWLLTGLEGLARQKKVKPSLLHPASSCHLSQRLPWL